MLRLHTKEISYYSLAIASLAASLLFSYRAAIVYYAIFLPLAGQVVAIGFGALIFLCLGVAEFVASLQWSKSVRNWIVIIIVMVHDGGSVVYAIFANHGFTWLLGIVALALTCISALPFIFGHWMQEFASHVASEREQRHLDWLNESGRRLQEKGVKLVEREVTQNPEKLRLFAPHFIRSVVEGTVDQPFPEPHVLHDTTIHEAISAPKTEVSYEEHPTEEHKIIPLHRQDEHSPLANGG